MDTRKDDKIPNCGSLADLRFRKPIVGTKQLKKALQKGTVSYVYLAKDADPAITEPLVELCGAGGIPYIWIDSMQQLGRACGIEVGAAAAAVAG